ncbi:TasA family protein [Virgibacillus sp. SK37]|uniref:TasA family protein n=1 Tax=Virgibacillus sp. SK37 TaxID=403957 RepID=UPI0004D18B75|nr:TasA family protein [Virgibacillus sp. SK37]AIF44177.1 cell division protein FtsN [Virgibacillus sp. SK37]
MNLKNSILTAVATATIGLCLIGSGTYAYFNDTEETNNTFAVGVLDLGIDKKSIIKVEKIIPGQQEEGKFQLKNDGNVDIKNVRLISEYKVNDYGLSNGGDDLGEHIKVQFKQNGKPVFDKPKSLAELQAKGAKGEEILGEFVADSPPKDFTVEMEFVNNGQNQNHFQKDILNLTWKFEAIQRDGNGEVVK